MGSTSFGRNWAIDEGAAAAEIEKRSAITKRWVPDWGTIIVLAAILQFFLSVMLDR